MSRWALLFAALGVVSCGTLAPQTRTGAKFEAELDTRAMRASIHAFAVILASTLEKTANDVLEAETEARIRRNALMWKANGVAAVYASAFISDPYIAAADLRALFMQLLDLSRSKRAQAWFGDWQEHVASETASAIAVADAFVDELKQRMGTRRTLQIREVGTEWARDHPIEDLELTRVPITFAFLRETSGEQYKGFAAVQKVEDVLDDLQNRSRLYAAALPRQARWQAEILIAEALHQPEAGDAKALLTSARRLLEQAEGSVDGLPAELDRQRRALATLVTRERSATMASAEAIALEAVGRLSAERAQLMSEFDAVVAKALDRAVLEVRSERATVFEATEALTDGLVEAVFARAVVLLG